MTLSMENLILLIEDWKQTYGQEYVARSILYMVVPGRTMARREMLAILVDTLIAKGYTKQDFDGPTRTAIENACVWEDWKEVKRLRDWRKRVAQDLTIVIAQAFHEEFIEITRDIDTSKRYVIDPNEEVLPDTPKRNSHSEEESVFDKYTELDFTKVPHIERDNIIMKTPEELEAEFEALLNAARNQ